MLGIALQHAGCISFKSVWSNKYGYSTFCKFVKYLGPIFLAVTAWQGEQCEFNFKLEIFKLTLDTRNSSSPSVKEDGPRIFQGHLSDT